MKALLFLILLLFSVPLFLNLFLISVLSRKRLLKMSWILGSVAFLLLLMHRPGLSLIALLPLLAAWWLRPRFLQRASLSGLARGPGSEARTLEAEFRKL
jgi:hypothetical protein